MGKAITIIVFIFAIGFGFWFWSLRADNPSNEIYIPTTATRILEVAETDPHKGKLDAPVTIIMVGSFSCPACKDSVKILDQLLALYPQDVRIVWKDLPETAGASYEAAVAARCAQRQGRYWDYSDRLFRKQDVLDTALLSEWAQDLGLRRAEFEACQASRSVRGLVDASISESLRLGIDSIPYFQINESESLQGVQNLTTFRAIVDNIINQS